MDTSKNIKQQLSMSSCRAVLSFLLIVCIYRAVKANGPLCSNGAGDCYDNGDLLICSIFKNNTQLIGNC